MILVAIIAVGALIYLWALDAHLSTEIRKAYIKQDPTHADGKHLNWMGKEEGSGK